jgi:hypothetical protein
MLTDIFARRYRDTILWRAYTQSESRLLVQAFGVVEEVIPFRGKDDREIYGASDRWTSIHDALSRELGVHELSPRSNGWGTRFPMDWVCKTFVTGDIPRSANADQLIKERLSFVELAFRAREQQLADSAADLPRRIQEARLRQAEQRAQLKKFGKLVRVEEPDVAAQLTAEVEEERSQFRQRVDELNERFRQAGSRLNYHNGFIQLGADPLVEREVERPFWRLVSEPRWKNVDTDMKEALDLRDSNGRDPAFYAARALESAIKIISEEKGWTTGKERGAHNFIDNLASNRFIAPWESDALKHFFTKVRNPLGHGPGSADMPELTPQQTQWGIETCMSWTKTLLERL